MNQPEPVRLYTWLFLHETGMKIKTIGEGDKAENLLEDMKRIYFVTRKQFQRETVRLEIPLRRPD